MFGEHGNNFVKTILLLAKTRDSLGGLDATTYADDVVAALIQIAEKIVAGEEVQYGIYYFTGEPYVAVAISPEQFLIKRFLKMC